MARAEFSKATKLLAFQRSGARCMQCTAKLGPGNTEYHHDKECTFGGTAELANCVVLCRACHRLITSFQAAIVAKSNRVRAKHLGLTRKRSSFQTNRDGKFRKRMDGTVVRRERAQTTGMSGKS